MRVISWIILVVLTACVQRNNYDVHHYISQAKEHALIDSIVRFAVKLPPGANHDTKMETRFDPYYTAKASQMNVTAYYINQSGNHFFMMTAPAASITPMEIAIGCKINYSPSGSVDVYEEIFRTWKMPAEKLNPRSMELFDKMVKGESLEPYYPMNAGDNYIEFPDGRFYFDPETRQWKDSVFDSVRMGGN